MNHMLVAVLPSYSESRMANVAIPSFDLCSIQQSKMVHTLCSAPLSTQRICLFVHIPQTFIYAKGLRML